MSGYWTKVPGARPKYTETGRRQNEASNSRHVVWNTWIQQFLTEIPQNNQCNSFSLTGSRKRPAYETNPQVGVKRPYMQLHTQSENAHLSLRQQHLDNIFSRLVLNKADKRASKRLVDEILKKIMRCVVEKEGGRIYSQQYVDAGSYPVRMKIGKADEFDVNIPLNISLEKVRFGGKVKYIVGQARGGSLSLNLRRELVHNSGGTAIPPGYAVAEVELAKLLPHSLLIFEERNSTSKFLHRSFCQLVQRPTSVYTLYRREHTLADYLPKISALNRSEDLQGCIELIPLDIKADLFERMTVAVKLFLMHLISGVSISEVSHGPALKMTIRPGWRSVVKHTINVDITVSLPCDIPLSTFGWPREETKMAFATQHINKVLEAGTHLVPKKDLFWAVSFSKAEKALLTSLDSDQGCRKYVAKILKKYVMTCSSQSSIGLPGISSHIIKTQVLWSCEKHASCPSYWNWGNRDVCLIKTMEELEETLISRRQPDYFYTALNILENKDARVLNTLVQFIRKKRNELMHM